MISGAMAGGLVAGVSGAEEVKVMKTSKMPVLFVGHGSPMNAIEDTEFSRVWLEIGKHLPVPEGILCVSAHWQTTGGTFVTAMEKPRTIHDFSGFPEELNTMEYPAPGAPSLAAKVQKAITGVQVKADQSWGLDHGTWSVMCRLFPRANVPVVQLSLDRGLQPTQHYEVGRELQPLRDQGVLIIGSGNMVHNLGIMEWGEKGFDWAVEFDVKLAELIGKKDHAALIDYPGLGPAAKKAIPTNEHYLPLLYVLALQGEREKLTFFADKVTLGSISMRSLMIG